MSSLRGEQALKDGLSFEFTWTARFLIEVLEERALSIQLGGQPGESGVDFRIEFHDHQEHHQVKRAFATSGEWSISELDSVGVLKDFRDRLVDPHVHCHFISSLNAVQLGYLADRARSAENFEIYRADYLSGEYVKWFKKLVTCWSLPESECWLRLRRLFTRVMDKNEVEASSLSMLRSAVEGDPKDIWVHLKDYCFSNLNQSRRASDLWQWLETKKYKRQVYVGSPRIIEALTKQTESYLSGVRRKLINPPFSRSVSAVIVEQLIGAQNGLDIVVLGAPGGGKSAVMLEITDSFLMRGWPVLAFRLDELSANCTTQDMQSALNLPVAPAQAVALAAAGLPALVVIDQLDAVSHYSGRTSVLLDRVAELVQELRGHRLRSPIHVLIACREIDWKHDGRLRQLHRPRYGPEMEDNTIHKIEELSKEEITSILKKCGLDAAAFSPRQFDELLRRPQYLALFLEANFTNDEITKIVTPKQLFDTYWKTKDRAMSQAFPGAGTNYWSGILKLITYRLSETATKLIQPQHNSHHLSDEAPLAVATRFLDNFPRTSIDWMITNGVLVEKEPRIRFGHESLFDYCFARFFEERGQSLLDYLCESDQTLIQRGQLRQVLPYMRDDNAENYIRISRELLDSDQIRPHLKLLLTVVLCSVPEPSDAEWDLVSSYVEIALVDLENGNTTSIACHMFYAFHGALPYFEKSLDSGALSRWISEYGPIAVDNLFRVILKHQETTQQKVWCLIEPIIHDERYKKQIECLSRFCKASQSRETFEWLLRVLKSEFEADDKNEDRRDRFYSLSDDLAKHQPIWFAEWLSALIDIGVNSQGSVGFYLIKDYSVEKKDIESVASTNPHEFVTHVLNAVIRASTQFPERSWHSWQSSWLDRDEISYISTEHVMLDSLSKSLTDMLAVDLTFVRKWLKCLSEVNSTICQTIYASVVCNQNPTCAGMAVDFLTAGGDNLHISIGGNLAAKRMIETHVSRFTEDQLERVQEVILNYYPLWQNGYGYGTARRKGEIPSCIGTYRGYAQMNLLRSFPEEYLSSKARNKLREFERKFEPDSQKLVKKHKERNIQENICRYWNPQQYNDALQAKENRSKNNCVRFDRINIQIEDLMRKAIKENPNSYITHFEYFPHLVSASYIKIVLDELVNIDLNPEMALRAAEAVWNNGNRMSFNHLYLLTKVPIRNLPESTFEKFLVYLSEGDAPDDTHCSYSAKRSDQLHSLAINSIRGKAIGAMAQWIWANPSLVEKISTLAPTWMRDTNAAIRAEMASICYAIAFKVENRLLAQELFAILANDSLPEDEILASYWPWKFMHSGLRDHWNCLEPIIKRMTLSEVSEVRASGARLACIALLADCNCFELAEDCVKSDDPNVRIASANIVSHNLHDSPVVNWMKSTFMKLANDPNKGVCRSACQGLYGSHTWDFSQMGTFLNDYLKTRAFLLNPRSLISCIEDSTTVLPNDVFAIVKTLLERLNEPVDDMDDRLGYHIGSVSAILKRLYHENRDATLRREALNLIDELCLRGSLGIDSLDQ